MTAPLISVQRIHKWYAGVHALKGVTLDVQPREVVGLVGDKARKIDVDQNTFRRSAARRG